MSENRQSGRRKTSKKAALEGEEDMNSAIPGMEDAREDIQEEELNKAIEELRGVLHDDDEEEGEPSEIIPEEKVRNTGIIMSIPVDVQIVLGSAEMPVSELMALQKGAVVALNRKIGEAVDVVVNGRKIASGEITVLEHDPSRFGIKLTQIIDATKPG